MTILNIVWDVEQKLNISIRFLMFSVVFLVLAKRSRASRLSVLVIFEWKFGKVLESSGMVVGGSAGRREPGGEERIETHRTNICFKE